jgi:hypothetical protein
MTLVKIDHLRRIDQFVDYFGEPRRTASNGPRPYGIAAVDAREPRRGEAASASVMTAHTFYAPV